MDDIVERLRATLPSDSGYAEQALEAAAEIERLRAPKETFGADATCLAVLLHLTSLLQGFHDGPFKDGFQSAIEEAGAYIDSLHDDGIDNAQTLMEQMCGLVNGHYALTEIKGPMGVVVNDPA